MDELRKDFVSVVIPAYNRTPYITQAIDSALGQQVPLEVIVVDDCSTDDLPGLMTRYREEPRVIYVRNEENLGVARTRNRGVSLAQGEYVAFLDADDYWAEGKLRLQLERIREKNAVICSTARELMTPEGQLTGFVLPVKEDITYQDMLRQNHIGCSSVLIKTQVAREFPMHHDDAHEDYLMWLEVFQKYRYGCAINQPLLKYRLSTTGKSGNKLHSARLTYRTYRYHGFGRFKALMCFSSYALCGVQKYFGFFRKRGAL